MRPAIPHLLSITLAASLLATSAGATIARAVPFDEKVDRADAIILAKCTRTTAAWDPAHRWILTYSTFKVEKALKGTAPDEVTLLTPGGTIDGVHQASIGIRPFREGDENVVFVRSTPAGPTVLYYDQGAYDVTTDGNGDKMVLPVATGAVLVDTQRGIASAAERRRPLSDFQEDVRASIERGGRRMELLRNRKVERPSLWSALADFKLLVLLAAAGVALSAWQFFRR